MKTTQIYNFINETQAEALGEKVITVRDTGSLASLGEHILNSEKLIEQWYKTLVDRIGRTYIKVRIYTRPESNMMFEPLEFGAILQKLQTYKIAKAKENNAWKEQVNPFTVLEKDETDIMQTFFKKRGTWEIDKIIYDYQLNDSFVSESNFMAFCDLILSDMKNGMEFEIEQLEKLTRATCYAQAFKTTNKNCARNLLAEYNTKFGEDLTTSECLMDADFLKFASMEINKVVKRMPRLTSVFNSMGADRHTDRDNLIVECLADYVSATSSYLESGTYHKELVSLPLYKELDCIQASGLNYDFADTSKIAITDEEGVTVEQVGVIACVRDRESCGISTYRLRTKSIYNPASELVNYYHKMDFGSFIDPSENCVVFYVADATDDAPVLNVSIPTSQTNVGSKTVGDLQETITINGTVLTGVSKYVTGYSDMFPNTPNGNFIALKFESNVGATISVRLVHGRDSEDWKQLDSDGMLIVRVTDPSTQYIVVKSVASGKTIEKVIKLDRLTTEKN